MALTIPPEVRQSLHMEAAPDAAMLNIERIAEIIVRDIGRMCAALDSTEYSVSGEMCESEALRRYGLEATK